MVFELVLYSAPIWGLLLTILGSLASVDNLKLQQKVVLSGSFLVFGATGSLWLYFYLNDFSVFISGFFLRADHLFMASGFLLLGLLIELKVPFFIEKMEHRELVYPTFLLFITGILGQLWSNNFLVITLTFNFSIGMLALLFYFAKYPKRLGLLRHYLIMNFISISLFLSINLFLYIKFGTLNFSILRDIIGYQLTTSQIYIVVLGVVAGFGLPFGLFPLMGKPMKNWYGESNPIQFETFAVIGVPLGIFQIIRFVKLFPNTLIPIGQILFFIGMFGFMGSAFYALMELFGRLKEHSRNIFKIIGFTLGMDFHLFLLFVGLAFTPNYVVSTEAEAYAKILSGVRVLDQLILLYLLFSGLFRIGILELLSPVIYFQEDWDLRQFQKRAVSPLYRHPWIGTLMLIFPILLLSTVLFGGDIFSQMISYIQIGQLTWGQNWPVLLAEFEFAFVILIILLAIEFTVVAVLYNEIFIKPQQFSKQEVDLTKNLKRTKEGRAFLTLFTILILAIGFGFSWVIMTQIQTFPLVHFFEF